MGRGHVVRHAGHADATVTYQWQGNGADITGATASTYVVQEGSE
jgi:hypothetical protein